MNITHYCSKKKIFHFGGGDMIVEGKKINNQFAGRKMFCLVSVLKRIFLLIQLDFKTKTKQ